MCGTVLHFLCYPTCDVLFYLNNNAVHNVWMVYDPLFGKHCVTDPALREYISVPQSICLFGEMRKSDKDACEMHPSRHAGKLSAVKWFFANYNISMNCELH